MSNKILYQRGFNDLFFKFIEDIIEMFSNDSDFIIAKTTFETLKKANPSSLIKAWYKFITVPFISGYNPNSESTEEDKSFSEKSNDRNLTEENLNILLFLKNFEVNFQNNKISELNNFFIKLNRELVNIIQNNDENENNKLFIIEKYFNQLNTLAVSFNI
jgi:hypothetical protein